MEIFTSYELITKPYKILVKDKKHGYCLSVRDILYVQAKNSWLCEFYTNEPAIYLIARPVSFYARELLSNGFIKINKAEYLNKLHVTGGHLSNHTMFIDDIKFDVSKRRAKKIHQIVGKGLVYSVPNVICTDKSYQYFNNISKNQQYSLRNLLSMYINNTVQMNYKIKAISGKYIESVFMEQVVLLQRNKKGTDICLYVNQIITSDVVFDNYVSELFEYGFMKITDNTILNFKYLEKIMFATNAWKMIVFDKHDKIFTINRQNIKHIHACLSKMYRK